MDASSLPEPEVTTGRLMQLWQFIRNRNVTLILLLCISFVLMLISSSSMQFNAQAAMHTHDDNGARRQIELIAPRGRILDRNGIEIAGSRYINMLYWADAGLNADDFNAVLLDLANTLDAYDLDYGEAIDKYIDIDRMRFAMDLEDIVYWQKNTNYLGLRDLPEDTESDYRDKRYVKTTPRDFFDYLAYTRFNISEDYSLRETKKILRMRFQIYLNNWSFSQGTPVLIARDIPDELVTIFTEQNFRFQGAVTTVEPVRVYHDDAIYLAHLVGYVGQISAEQYSQLNRQGYTADDVVGKSGIELVAERYLHGKRGVDLYNVWGSDGEDGYFASAIHGLKPTAGDDVTLTIDLGIQKATMESLSRLINIYNNDNEFVGFPDSTGAAVMLDLKNDLAVLAMASLPTFNPQDFIDMENDDEARERVAHYLTDSKTLPMLNRAIALPKAPGSTFKVFTAAALLQHQVVNPYSLVHCPGYYEIDDMRFGCEGVHGNMDLDHAIAYSCNVYFYEKGVELGIDHLSSITAELGLNERADIELYGESAGIHASRDSKILYNQDPSNQLWYPADTAQTSIGQGLTATTVLQLARATAAVATGELGMPHVIQDILASDGTLTMQANSSSVPLSISDAVLQEVRDGMLLMTTDEMSTVRGHFESAEYSVAGKTGTAETIVYEHGPTTDGVYIAFAPYEDPEVAVAVLVETGARGAATSQVARGMFDAYFGDEAYELGEVYQLPGLNQFLEDMDGE